MRKKRNYSSSTRMHYYSISQSDTERMSVGRSYKGRWFGLTKSKHKCLILSSICNIWWKTAVFHSIIKIYFNRQWLFKAIKKRTGRFHAHILLANPPSCEMLLYTLWKDGGRHMEIQTIYLRKASKHGPGIWMIPYTQKSSHWKEYVP